MELKTARLLLRPFRADDTEALYAYSKDEPVGRNAGWKPHESLLESNDILHLVFLDQPSVWAIERKADGRMIGSIGLIADSKREYGSVRSLGYALGVDYWGQGFMTEAVQAVLRYGFGPMSLDLITATCYPDNPASRRVLEKCGFRYEGTLHRAELLYNGEIKDHLCFYLTHEQASGKELHT
ncbi:MAG: GNAT family N-acetyltransferase [Agathobaculum sp.]|jgi:RimJ/RimL family protein N-acetyltransferase|uniref:GNAT family N-acetyltransferase n=1 Tax=Agathobaculum sp. TaxID=2048138 RepID=UPI003D8B0904